MGRTPVVPAPGQVGAGPRRTPTSTLGYERTRAAGWRWFAGGYALSRLAHRTRRSLATALLLTGAVAGARAQAPASHAWIDPSPHRIRHVPVARGVQLEVLDWGGNGPALVFLAGMGNTAHVYDDFAPRFRDRFHVYAITRRGFGTSSAPVGGYDAGTRARDIVAVLDSVHVDRAVLAGHSIAGDELSKVGAAYPGRVRALVYLDAYDYGPARIAAMGASQQGMGSLMPSMTATDSASPAAVTAFVRRAYPHIGAMPESETRATAVFGPDDRLAADGPGAAAAPKIMAGTETPDFAHVAAPALGLFVVYPGPAAFFSQYAGFDAPRRARADRAFTAFTAWSTAGRDRFRAEVPLGTVVELSDAGHYVFLTRPDRVEREMRAFLARAR